MAGVSGTREVPACLDVKPASTRAWRPGGRLTAEARALAPQTHTRAVALTELLNHSEQLRANANHELRTAGFVVSTQLAAGHWHTPLS